MWNGSFGKIHRSRLSGRTNNSCDRKFKLHVSKFMVKMANGRDTGAILMNARDLDNAEDILSLLLYNKCLNNVYYFTLSYKFHEWLFRRVFSFTGIIVYVTFEILPSFLRSRSVVKIGVSDHVLNRVSTSHKRLTYLYIYNNITTKNSNHRNLRSLAT